MLIYLLVLLSLVSAEGTSNLATMVYEVLNRRYSDFNFYGCQCGILVYGDQIVDGIDRCCYEHYCCYKRIQSKACRPGSVSYDYTYSNGTITCDNKEFTCTRQTCECDRQTVLCFMSHPFIRAYAKYKLQGKCKGKQSPCPV